MKTILLLISYTIGVISLHAQSNTFPATGNVGIGTLSPGATLVVNSISSSILANTNGIVINHTGDSNNHFSNIGFSWQSSTGTQVPYWGMGFKGTNFSSGSGDLLFYTGGTEQLRLTQYGKVGVGIAAPDSKFQVDNQFNTAYSIGGSIVGTTDFNNVSGLFTNYKADADYSVVRLATRYSGSAIWDIVNIWKTDAAGDLAFRSRTGGATSREAMRLSYTGNVGIGTPNPASKLEVVADGGANSIMNTAYRNSGGQASFESRFARGSQTSPLTVANGDVVGAFASYPHNGNNFNLQTAIMYTKVNGAVTGTSIPTDIIFSTDALGFAYTPGKERMIIKANGNIGIGVTSPAEKLSVNGNISSRKSIVTQVGWSDYVFNEDYKLRPLAEVAQFIKENKHLPEIPSAQEIKQKGLDLGDSHALLLKKIEELTLYLLAQEEKNTRQDARIRELEQQLKGLQRIRH